MVLLTRHGFKHLLGLNTTSGKVRKYFVPEKKGVQQSVFRLAKPQPVG